VPLLARKQWELPVDPPLLKTAIEKLIGDNGMENPLTHLHRR
jgi:hypothetical protein